ncbi:MAG: hypothetical protein K2L16_07815 [Muribaculaceae bacterium]|nr:hypothetical protein [Muribaculaceae bacterium]
MKTSTQHAERDAAFVRSAMSILGAHMARGERLSRRELIAKALASRPPYFYVEADRAVDVFNFFRHRPWPSAPTLRQQMWMEFCTMVREEMEGPRRLKLSKAVAFVLNFRRPSRFYISEQIAQRLIRRHVARRSYIVRS